MAIYLPKAGQEEDLRYIFHYAMAKAMTSKAKLHKQLQLNCTGSVSSAGQPPESSGEEKVGELSWRKHSPE